jgi:hypothetical protein
MNCTKNEAALVLRWYRKRSNLLLVFQASVNTEAVHMRGLISRVAADGFLFVSKSCSVSIPFDFTVFEYEKGTKEEMTQGKTTRRLLSSPIAAAYRKGNGSHISCHCTCINRPQHH